MAFDVPAPAKPKLAELDERMLAVESSIKSLEDTEWIAPGAGTAPGSLKWDLVPRQITTLLLPEAEAISLVVGPSYANLLSTNVAAGRYLARGIVCYRNLSGSVAMTFTAQAAAIVSGTLPAVGEFTNQLYGSAPLAGALGIDVPIAERELVLGSTTTVYLIARAGWSGGGAVGAFGKLVLHKIS